MPGPKPDCWADTRTTHGHPGSAVYSGTPGLDREHPEAGRSDCGTAPGPITTAVCRPTLDTDLGRDQANANPVC